MAGQLEGLGLTLTADDVVTSSQAGAARLAQLVPQAPKCWPSVERECWRPFERSA